MSAGWKMNQNDTKLVVPQSAIRCGFKSHWSRHVDVLRQLFPQLDLQTPLITQVDSITLFEVISRWESATSDLEDACIDWMVRRGLGAAND
jgi:hypothetical protein